MFTVECVFFQYICIVCMSVWCVSVWPWPLNNEHAGYHKVTISLVCGVTRVCVHADECVCVCVNTPQLGGVR